jgi:hypothetical protein
MQPNIRKNVYWITRTAVLTALLVTLQFITTMLGNTLVTGSVVNLLLVISFLTCGPATGFTVAIISPVCASLVGVGPAFPPLIPFIALGNAVFIAVWYLVGLLNKSDKTGGRSKAMKLLVNYSTAIAAALIKFLTLYAGIVKIAMPYILDLNEKQSAVLSFSFSYPQIITATIGGALALSVVPPVKKALGAKH